MNNENKQINENIIYPYPQPLLLMNPFNNCLFCINPKGTTNVIYISSAKHFGYITCNKCIYKAENAKEQWLNTNAFGPIKYLQNINLNIKNYNGIIENNWKLNNDIPMTETINGELYVYCIHNVSYNTILYSVNSIIELNPIN